MPSGNEVRRGHGQCAATAGIYALYYDKANPDGDGPATSWCSGLLDAYVYDASLFQRRPSCVEVDRA